MNFSYDLICIINQVTSFYAIATLTSNWVMFYCNLQMNGSHSSGVCFLDLGHFRYLGYLFIVFSWLTFSNLVSVVRPFFMDFKQSFACWEFMTGCEMLSWKGRLFWRSYNVTMTLYNLTLTKRNTIAGVFLTIFLYTNTSGKLFLYRMWDLISGIYFGSPGEINLSLLK